MEGGDGSTAAPGAVETGSVGSPPRPSASAVGSPPAPASAAASVRSPMDVEPPARPAPAAPPPPTNDDRAVRRPAGDRPDPPASDDDDDDDDEAWGVGRGGGGGGGGLGGAGAGSSSDEDGSRYPIHDACEFEDADALRRLIFVPQSEEEEEEDSSVDSSSEDKGGGGASSSDSDASEERGREGKEGGEGGEGVAAPSDQPMANAAGAAVAGAAANPPQAASFENGANSTTQNVGKTNNDGAQQHRQKPKKPAATLQRIVKYSCPYDLDERDDDENTPLHIAIHARKLDSVRLLLEAGATVHKKCDGSAPVHLAISLGAIGKHAEFARSCLELLRERGADLTMRDDSWHTPLYLACISNFGPIVEILLNDPLSKETINWRADRTGGRALHAAAKCDLVRDAPRMMGGMAAMMRNSHRNQLHGAGSAGGGRRITELLLETEGIDVDAQNNYGRTALHIAVMRGNWHAARLLLKAGADAQVLDKRGLTPGQWARKRGKVIPNDLTTSLLTSLGGADVHLPPTRDQIMDPDGSTAILCHELCGQHRTCPPIVRGDEETSEPPPENVRRLYVLINSEDGILRAGEFNGCKWYTEVRRAALSDVLKVHEYPYVERASKLCASTPDHPRAIQTLDADTTVSRWSFEAALRAAGSVCEAVDKVMAGDHRNAFCAIRPPGHHAGPKGIVTCPNDPVGSHGFCLLNNVAIGAAYARSMYRNDGVKKVAIIDFDVHHGNGTEEIVRWLTPKVERAIIQTPFAMGSLHTSTYKPWLDENDINDVFFASTHGYGPRDRLPGTQGGWFYPASGRTFTSKSLTSTGASEIKKESPSLSDFLLSQTWSRLGEEMRNDCCKIINIGLGLPHKDDTYNYGLQRLELRDSYRKNILPSLLEHDPDMIFVSAGFDAHRRDSMNFGYVGMVEEDYEWLTEQLVKVANTCCNGRIISALEGGYKTHGGIVSPFARSVASHVRALVDGSSSREMYDAKEAEWESRYERHMNDEKEKKRQMRMDRNMSYSRTHASSSSPGIVHNNSGTATHQDHLTAVLGPGSHDKDAVGNGNGDAEPSRKRTRNEVDYKQLFEQMKREGA
ncbi:hypothetical protein ACHAWF_016319 [Thalassiosira exigua]